jgi:hypothetical protein
MTYYNDYPTKPIGKHNPYSMCAYCHVPVPQINGQLDNHEQQCVYRVEQQRLIDRTNFPQIYIIAYCCSDGYTYSCSTAVPVMYKSLEALIVDFETTIKDSYENHNRCVALGGVDFDVDDFYGGGHYNEPDFYTVEQWYESMRA